MRGTIIGINSISEENSKSVFLSLSENIGHSI